MNNMSEYEYALLSVSSDPDIYFDESDNETYLSDTELGARTIISLLINASKNDTVKLHALMCVFAGLPLRGAAKIVNRSHEWIRQVVDSVEEEYPELHKLLKGKSYTVQSLVPVCHRQKWIIECDGKKIYIKNLVQYCRENSLKYETVIWSINKKGFYKFKNEKIRRIRNEKEHPQGADSTQG